MLIDEIEHGLEPHRIIGAIAQLKADQATALEARRPIGQILMTTHSDVALGEAGAESLQVVQTVRPGRATEVARPNSTDPLRPLMRFTPRALFARRILVTEGNTELGLLLGLREHWPARHGGRPIEQLGAAVADGNGEQASSLALALARLGYRTAMFRDSDTVLAPATIAALAAANVSVFEYGGGLNTEQAIFSAANDELVQLLLAYAREERGDAAVDDNLNTRIPDVGIDVIRGEFADWFLWSALDETQLREAVAEVAVRKKWFKDQRIGRGLAPLVARVAAANNGSPLATALAQVEAWLYA